MLYTDFINGVLTGINKVNVTFAFGQRLVINGKVIVASHRGIDMTPVGKVRNIQRGKVIEVRSNITPAQTPNIITLGMKALYSGNLIRIQHGNGYVSIHEHLAYGSILVKVGDIVDKFQDIATAGGTGYTTGAHEHFGLFLNGVAVDPLPYLQGKKQVAPYIEAEITERPRQSVLIASVASQFYRKDPNGDTIAYLKLGVQYPIIGFTNQVNGFKWAQIIVDNAIVYSALNPSWNKVVDPAPVEVIKEVLMPIARSWDIDPGFTMELTLKEKV